MVRHGGECGQCVLHFNVADELQYPCNVLGDVKLQKKSSASLKRYDYIKIVWFLFLWSFQMIRSFIFCLPFLLTYASHSIGLKLLYCWLKLLICFSLPHLTSYSGGHMNVFGFCIQPVTYFIYIPSILLVWDLYLRFMILVTGNVISYFFLY